MKKATHCKRCKRPETYHGALCKPCWRIRERELLYGGTPPPAKARTTVEVGEPCPSCGRPISAGNKHPNYSLCHPCGVKKRRAYQQERRDLLKPKPRPKATQEQRIELKKKDDPPMKVVNRGNVKVTKIQSACPSFAEYSMGPGSRFYS